MFLGCELQLIYTRYILVFYTCLFARVELWETDDMFDA